MASINIKKTPTANVSNPPSGSTSLYVNASGDLSLKDEAGKIVSIGGYKVSNSVYPTGAYFSRVLEDSGNIKDLNHLTELYIKNLSLLDSTVFLWNGEAGAKRRTSGSNTFASKAYNMANKVQQFGGELVTNGTFTGADGSTPAGWSPSDATFTIDANRLKIYNTSAYGGVSTAFATTIGKTYHLTGTFTFVDCNGEINTTNIPFDVPIVSSGWMSSSKTVTLSFVATSTTTYVNLTNITPNVDKTSFWDNISVKQMDWIEGTNDAVQTTEANQPYVGGLIAPNEVGKLKTFNNVNALSTTPASIFSSNDSWSLTGTILLNHNGTGAIVKRLFNGDLSAQIRLQGGLYFVSTYANSVIEIIGFELLRRNLGKVITFTVVARGGSMSTYLNGVLVNTLTTDTAYNFRHIYAEDNQVHNLQIFNRALSASEIQAQHDFLRLQIPEIEGIAIGNQYWATSNYEGVVTGDRTVIPEYKYTAANSPELIDNGDFATSDGWFMSGGWSVAAGIASNSGVYGDLYRYTNAVTKNNFAYKLTYTISNYVSGSVRAAIRGSSGTINSGNGTFSEIIITAGSTDPFFYITGDLNGSIDNISVKEAGWDEAQAIYDYIYAATPDTVAVKELEALKAAAMWCYYDNNVNNGAIYGKLYNWYAVKLISLYPPQGWRVPTQEDYIQLQTYLGGSTVAGGKMKALYQNFNNINSTNESGFSSIAGGFRSDIGSFLNLNIQSWFGLSDTSTGKVISSDSTSLQDSSAFVGTSPIIGDSIRLLRNSPVGPNEKTITSTTIVSNIASTANSTQIPFGYSVASIRLKTTANLTNIKVELWNNYSNGLSPALVSTLITGKTANNTTMVFPVLADSAALLQDGTLRITATGAAAFETIVEYNLQKNTF